MRENNRAARAARTLVELFDVVSQTKTKTGNFQIYSCNNNVNTLQ